MMEISTFVQIECEMILGFGGADESKIDPAAQTLSKLIRELL